jgi:ubiquinone/menaquinone biosynthesis C-methylase UbiE
MRRAENVLEFLDRPVARADRDATLGDVHRLNAWFGGYRLTRRWIRRFGADGANGRALVIDVGGGGGDFARWLVDRAGGPGASLRVVVVDRELTLLPTPGVLGVCADATALPFRAGAADLVTATLTLHHLEAAAAVRGLAEMRAVARRGVVVNDLLRTRLTLALVWLATRLFARHRFARHDGPLSVRRAYAPDEIGGLAEKAGLSRVDIHRYPWLGRLVAVLR